MSVVRKSLEQGIAPELLLDQSEAQRGKNKYRSLGEYNRVLFGPKSRSRKPNEPVELLEGITEGFSLINVINGLKDRSEKPPHWVDVAGGLAVAMRQLARQEITKATARTALTSVDIFYWEEILGSAGVQEIAEDYGFSAAIMEERFRPNMVVADAHSVSFEQPADLLTCVEGISYFDEPLKVITNSYNQLSDDGLMIVSRNLPWTHHVTRQGTQLSIFDSVAETLAASDIKFGFDWKWENPEARRTLSIRKKPGTQIQPAAGALSVNKMGGGYKTVIYPDVEPMVQVRQI